MDPDEVLNQLREMGTKINEASDPADAILYVSRFQALDEWISKGGFLPDSWARGLKLRRPENCDDPECNDSINACPEHPSHNGSDHTYEQHHDPADHIGPGPCRCKSLPARDLSYYKSNANSHLKNNVINPINQP